MDWFGKRRSPTRMMLYLILAGFACVLSMVAAADELCHRDISRRQPLYPNAEIVERHYDFIRPRAIGTTTLILSTPDDEETVRQWMREVTLDLLQREAFNGLATVMWDTEPDPDGSGTRIRLYSECAR